MQTLNQINPLKYIHTLHRATDGYITLFHKRPEGGTQQYHYKLEQLTDDLLKSWVTYDSYVSLNSFYTAKRSKHNLRTIHNLYVDIDCHNVKLTPEQVLMALEADFFGQSMPTPNIVLYSGRGLALIWHIEPISGLAHERWLAVQRAIFNQLVDFGADPSSTTDTARVFRLPASINSKSNEIVRYDVLTDYIYELSEIGKEYFGIIPNPPKKAQDKRPRAKAKPKRAGRVQMGFNGFSLCQARLHDLEKLIQMRNGVMPKQRERLLFLARYYALKITNNEKAAIQKMQYLNSLFAVPLKESELLNSTLSAVTYVKEGTGINISNKTLIEWFFITPEEQQQLTTIISKTEKNERDRVKKEKARRAAGTQTQAKRNAKRRRDAVRNAKRIQLIKAMHPNHSIRELAARAGLSKSYVADLLKRMGELLSKATVDKGEQVSVAVSSLVGESAKGLYASTGSDDLLVFYELIRRQE